MDWKREAAEKLRLYEAKRESISQISTEIRRLENELSRVRSAIGDGTAVRGDMSRREDMLINNIARREELMVAMKIVKVWVEMVDKALAILNDEERLVLRRFYINPARGNVERLCGELGVEQATVYRRRDAALRRFCIALYGVVET